MGTPTRLVSRAVARRTRLVKPWTHWATSADLVSLRMPAHDAGTGLSGEALGQCQYGASFG